ncbi:hypothetical protein EON83_01235 [bacterium]|nr:MAG: hypothetical protein EON83_01235 [bacterium]
MARPQRATAQATAWSPPSPQTYSSSREIDRLIVLPDGTLWAKTSGGALRLQNGEWKKFNAAPAELGAPLPPLKWRGQTVSASIEGLAVGTRPVPLPNSSGTHISALLPRGSVLWAALFGDGIWAWDGAKWSGPPLQLPDQAREITSLAQSANGQLVWAGTRRQGVWQYSDGTWKQHLEPNEPFAHNIQYLQSYRGALWGSTLEDGLVIRDAKGWQHIGKGTLSSNAPRQMVVFAGKLYVRHSNEVVDQFDGTTWKRNVFPTLPRKQIISMAADNKRLYLGQWGGWSEWDSKTFSHHLRIPELQIVPLQHIVPDGNDVWLGTENRGLFHWKRATQTLEHSDERNGLPDHWITGIKRTGNTVFVGTFGSGLAIRNDGEKIWQAPTELKQTGITALVSDSTGNTWIATRYGLFCCTPQGQIQARNASLDPDEREIQTLLPTPTGLWLGNRNNLLFRPYTVLK